jgi:glutaredoxin
MTWNELKTHTLLVYSTAWCGDCRRFKACLDEHGVAYREIDIDRDAGAAESLKKRTNRMAIPYLEVDGRAMVRGWHEEAASRWDETLFLDEVQQALDAG